MMINRHPFQIVLQRPPVAHTYSFGVIVAQRGVLIVRARQCREVLVVDGEILRLFC